MNKLLGVYGTLRKGHHNHYLLHGARHVDTIKTPPIFEMRSTGSFPILTPGEESVIMEVYEIVDPGSWRNICQLEGYYGPEDPRNWYGMGQFDKSKLKHIHYFYMSREAAQGLPKVVGGDWHEYSHKRLTSHE